MCKMPRFPESNLPEVKVINLDHLVSLICLLNIKEAKIHPDSGSFCTCVGNNYLDKIYTKWKEKLMPIEGVKFSSDSQDMRPLGIFEAEIIFPHPAEIIRLKFESFVMNNCTSQDFMLGNDYHNIYCIDINNCKYRYFTIVENKRQKFAFPLEKREKTLIKQLKNVNKEKFVTDKLIEAQISLELTSEMKEDLIEILFQYRKAFASDNEPIGAIKGHKVERPHHPLL
ncbi:hypothetical protein O181_017500 [Austropuccinia psidii MF-1]|uniref:Uncharacterized protein n=1 Tax=Austropuccinia psidii MF-1 TaxID=1389203 RepID=A0A9Q3C6W0_9BASI|nr:hypothetical protein [Austropuccinia psidii MF-1]